MEERAFRGTRGKPLNGANKCTHHFDKGDTSPVNAFWSVTLYDNEGFQVGNVLNRFAFSCWDDWTGWLVYRRLRIQPGPLCKTRKYLRPQVAQTGE
ncbi:DUF1214 domain-containing protein [Pseudomonas sp. IT-P253]|uniref:DUF1214 domain-containing protein n=1 Tax=Pseudomonas sp. IT-P253 TaxID=3026455 RepID=UPI0039E18FE2